MKLASIEEIAAIEPHDNADSLEIAKILGWQSIVKKGEFAAGDNVVFAVIDTILPKAPWSEFLADKKNPDKPIRLRTVKLRGKYSQGLVLPLSVLPEAVRGWHVGADVGGALGIKKYEKEIPAQLAGEIAGGFPAFIVAPTDEDNGLSYPDIVEEVFRAGQSAGITATLKLDGSSCTVVVKDGRIEHVCSRRYSLKEQASNGFWHAARKLAIPSGWSGCIQGELMGPGVQGNQLKLSEPELVVFQIKDPATGYMAYDAMEAFSIGHLKAKVTPAIRKMDPQEVGPLSLEFLQEVADALSLPSGEPAEGIVVRPSDYRPAGNGRPLGFKIINRNYKD